MIPKSRTINIKDNLENSRRQLFSLRKKIIKDKVLLIDLAELLPVGVCFNDLTGNQFVNLAGEDIFSRSREELKIIGSKFYDTCFYPRELIPLTNLIERELENLHQGHVTSTFMHIRRPKKANDQLIYQTLTTIPTRDSYSGLIIGITPKQLGVSNRKISRIIEEDELVIRYFEAFQRLTKREKEIIMLVVYGHTNPQIAEMLCISRATVETHRKNINRKLDIHSFYKLVRFAQAFDLV